MLQGDGVKKDRSWVVPLAFVTFGGIVIAAIFAFLWQEDMLLSVRGAALVAWLTLIVTVLAFGAALIAIRFALIQVSAARSQIDRFSDDAKARAIETANNIDTIVDRIWKCHYSIYVSMQTGTIYSEEIQEKKYEISNNIVELRNISHHSPEKNFKQVVIMVTDFVRYLAEFQKMQIIAINEGKINQEIKSRLSESTENIRNCATEINELTKIIRAERIRTDYID